jgi:diguanylate cyclase (GGDEF)-like protein
VVLLIYFFCIHLGMTAFVLTLIPFEYTLVIVVLIGMGIVLAIKTLHFIEDKMAIRLRISEQESMVDEYTGLSSFRYFTRRVIEEINSCDRYGQRSFSLLIFELNGFSESLRNLWKPEERKDRFQEVSRFFQENIRSSDLVSHLGEDSFVVMTPERGEGRDYLIQRLKTIFRNMQADRYSGSLGDAMTLSIRAVEYPGNQDIVHDLLREAVEVS